MHSAHKHALTQLHVLVFCLCSKAVGRSGLGDHSQVPPIAQFFPSFSAKTIAPTIDPERLATTSSDVQKVINLISLSILIHLVFYPNIIVHGKFFHPYMFIRRYHFYFQPSIHQAA